MSSVFFPSFNEFSPLFRLANEIDRATRTGSAHCGNGNGNGRSFAPKFDVRETKETYELHGELPGIEQSNVNIEWADDTTLTISGQTERNYSNIPTSTEAEDVEVVDAPEDGESSANGSYHKPTVEDDTPAESETETEQAVAPTPKAEVTKRPTDGAKYWVTERSIGSFHRTFQFPGRVDHDAVRASLKNGVLNIVVPKAKAREPRKINIE